MRKYMLTSLLIASLYSCQKQEKTYTVVYKVTTSEVSPSYTVSYTTQDGATKTQGIITAQYWNSGSLKEFHKGAHLSFSLTANGGIYQMTAYVNGNIEQTRAAGPSGTQTLTVDLPD